MVDVSSHAKKTSNDSVRTSAKGKTLEYSVESVSDSVIDWRLQVRPCDSTTTTSSSSASSLSSSSNAKAQWYRERELTEQDEIVDKLLEARTGRVVWTSHRPVRGWYLHLRSPALPAGMAIPLQSVRSNQAGCTPLSFAIGSRLDHSAVPNLKSFVTAPCNISSGPQGATNRHEDDQFTVVPLNAQGHSSADNNIADSNGASHARTSSRSMIEGHVRRRSAGQSTSVPGSRSVSKTSQTEAVQEEREEEEEGGVAKVAGEAASLASTETKNSIASHPQMCHFLLSEDVDQHISPAKLGWARWAWTKVPEPLRSPLGPGSSRTFSVLWLDAPTHPPGPIEVLRFEDDTAWWNWKGKKRGRILVQQEAIKALRLDLAFWMALSLAYLEFLEERDGYHAALDG